MRWSFGALDDTVWSRLDQVKWLAWLFLGWTFWLGSGHTPVDPPLTTPLRYAKYRGEMRVVVVTYARIPSNQLDDRALAYFDSG